MGLRDILRFGKQPPMTEQGRAMAAGLEWQREWALVSDDLLTRKGTDLYTEMRHDPDVKVGLLLKSCGVLAKGWALAPGVAEGEDGYEQAQEQSDFVQQCFDAMPGSLDDILEEVLFDGLALGTSIGEKNFLLRDDGRVGYKSLKPKDPQYYYLILDDYNNIERLILRGLGADEALDPAKFWFFTHQSSHSEPWGLSDLRAAYRYYWAKRKIMEWWLIWLEKYGMPIALGKAPRGTPAEVRTALLTTLNTIKQETAIVIDDDQTVELLVANQTAQGGFEAALEFCGKQITKAILGQTLSTDQGTSGRGSYAQAKVHQDVLSLFIRKLKRQTEEFVDEQIIRDLIDYNFAEHYYPNFSLKLDEADLVELSEVFFRLTQSSIVDGRETWIREYLNLPPREELPEEVIPDVPGVLGAPPTQSGIQPGETSGAEDVTGE